MVMIINKRYTLSVVGFLDLVALYLLVDEEEEVCFLALEVLYGVRGVLHGLEGDGEVGF